MLSTPAVDWSLWRCCYSPGLEFSVWSLLLPLSDGRQGSRIEWVRASQDLYPRPTRDARSWRRNGMIAGGNGGWGLEEQGRVTPPGATAVLGYVVPRPEGILEVAAAEAATAVATATATATAAAAAAAGAAAAPRFRPHRHPAAATA